VTHLFCFGLTLLMADNKPRVLILGGCGFVGRNLVVYLVKNDLAASIKVADKSLPMTSWLTPEQKECFDKVTFIQANLAKENFLSKVFKEPGEYDYVFNCAAETKASQPSEDYESRVYDLALKCAEASAKNKVKRFVEVSDAAVYSPQSKKGTKEDGKIEPWTIVAQYKARVEEALAKISGFVISFFSSQRFSFMFFFILSIFPLYFSPFSFLSLGFLFSLSLYFPRFFLFFFFYFNLLSFLFLFIHTQINSDWITLLFALSSFMVQAVSIMLCPVLSLVLSTSNYKRK
jgi:hypothetical protein